MKSWIRKFVLVSAVLVLLPGCSHSSSPRELTDAPFRLAWIQDQDRGVDTMGRGTELRLMGYDSERIFRKTRPILNDVRNYFKPLITPDGSQVVFSDFTKNKIYVIDWNGRNKKTLGSGVAVEVWKDPASNTVWVYCFDGPQLGGDKDTDNDIYRFPLGAPSQRELIWNETRLTWDNFQLSQDGKRAGGMFPWPHGGVLDLEKKTMTKMGRGCWTSFSPDNQYILWIFDGPHRNVMLYPPDRTKTQKVTINKAPGIDGYEVYHPRWSNQSRFMVMTGPYKEGEGGNRIRLLCRVRSSP